MAVGKRQYLNGRTETARDAAAEVGAALRAALVRGLDGGLGEPALPPTTCHLSSYHLSSSSDLELPLGRSHAEHQEQAADEAEAAPLEADDGLGDVGEELA